MTLTLVRDNSGRCIGLRLPAEPADIAAAYEKLDAVSTDDRQTRILRADTGVGSLDRYLRDRPMNRPGDYIELGELAESIALAWSGKDAFKLTAALAAEKPAALDEAIELTANLNRYEFIQCSAEDYGRNALLELCGDREVLDTLDGFIDWSEFGRHMMQEDGIVQTEYGAIRRPDDPASEQAMGVQTMQGPFL